MSGDTQQLVHPGVVVVGAGATGLITAIELHRRGVSALVVERKSACAMQSGQCHGWLHRGAVFPDAEDADVEQLAAGADWWQEAAGSGWLIDGEVTGSEPSGAERVRNLWTRLAVPHCEVEPVLSRAAWSMRGGEPSVIPNGILRNIAAASGIAIRTAEVREFLPGADSRSVGGVRVMTARKTVDVRAPVVVLAAGAGIRQLLPSYVGLSERLSFMLVVRSKQAPVHAFTIPEQRALGMMAVPRERAGARHLLVSNFVSYAASADHRQSRSAWLRGVAATLRDLLPQVWSDPEALWGVYGAVKVERERRLGLGVPGTAAVDTQFRNVLVGVPGKLVLAPALAARLAERCVEELATGAEEGEAPLAESVDAVLPSASWGPEAWERTHLMSRVALFG